MKSIDRRHWLAAASATATALALSPARRLLAAESPRFDPQPGPWRRFEVTTEVELSSAQGKAARVWLPLPSVESSFQRLQGDTSAGTAASTSIQTSAGSGARMLVAEFDAAAPAKTLQSTSRIETRSRSTDWQSTPARTTANTPANPAGAESPAELRRWLQPTDLVPIGGIVHETALKALHGASADSDSDKVRAIYGWIVANTYREPKVRGCGTGDIRAMLELGDLGGKCADLNALFVGLCRAVGVPARDVYGLRLAPSAFGYRALGSNSAKLQGAQHCRAEAWLEGRGWVAMDPADVAKVMREETANWIKDERDPLVAPVRQALFGGWEGNWMAYNMAPDLSLPGSTGRKLGFLMYPQAEIAGERIDPLDAAAFSYRISAREITGA